jgi:hypothetical protein
MKKIFLILVLATAATQIKAQDLIIKKNGEEIKGKIEEISPDMIRYKSWENLRGPLILIPKKDVVLIKYENGTNYVVNTPENKPGSDNSNIYIVNPKPAPVPAKAPPVVTEQPGATEIMTQEHIRLSGPRIGVTYIAPGKLADRLEEKFDARPVLSQFGWQFETRLFTLENGPSGLVEFVPLIGGLEQGMFLPSASILLGIRSQSGFEIGAGPNFSVAGAGVVIAAGTSYTIDNVHFPVNVAVVPSRDGTRYSLTFGFNYRKRY